MNIHDAEEFTIFQAQEIDGFLRIKNNLPKRKEGELGYPEDFNVSQLVASFFLEKEETDPSMIYCNS